VDKDWTLYRSVFIDDAFIDYFSAGVIAGSLDEVTDPSPGTSAPWC
jgi:hypothetical protein